MTPEQWQEVKKVLAGALGRTPADRRDYLDHACTDPSLRREVESLILAHEQAGSELLSSPATQTGGAFLLEPGAMLGPYEILAPIGAGGMGQVYRARDTRLNRTVAIKVLPEAFAHDPDRLARFQREAKLLAALNHPNIATIHGLEQANGTHYLVMELVAGETLADRVHREGALPIEEALPVARQIAEALEAAHEKGIIHRDLKPANVKVTPEGKVKVLDFGLAKAFAGDGATEDPSNSPTLSAMVTVQGVILGTAAYMSPEQARGKAVDKRTDIWAFGCVLFELLSGRVVFSGATISDTIAAILEREPDWSALPKSTSATIRRLLRRCLEKNPMQRLRDIGDARVELEETVEPTLEKPPGTVSRMSLSRSQVTAGAVALALAAIVGAGVWMARRSAGPPTQAAHLAVAIPPGDDLVSSSGGTMVAISPDGRGVVYAATRLGKRLLYFRGFDTPDARALPGTENARTPFFSPDGHWVAFFSAGKLRKISITGEGSSTICDAPIGRGGSWAANDTIYFVPYQVSEVWSVSAAGGTPRQVTTLKRENGEVSHAWPQLLPGGRALLFTVETGPGDDEQHIDVQFLDTGERRVLVRGGHHGIYVSGGYLVYLREGRLLAVPFDLAHLEAAATPPVVVAEHIWDFADQDAPMAVSDTGSLAYVPGNASPQKDLVWVSRSGQEESVGAPPGTYTHPRLSSSDKELAVQTRTPVGVAVYDFSRGTLTPLTPREGSAQRPVWTADGRRVTYRGTRRGYRNLFWKSADGSGEEQRLTNGETYETPDSWSPDGKILAFVRNNRSGGSDIWMLRLDDGKRTVQPFLQTGFTEGAARFSPDGRWLSYSSNRSGRSEVYAQAFPGPSARIQISSEGGNSPVWARNGRELFYRNGQKMMVVDFTPGPVLAVGKPRLLFAGQYETAPDTDYDVSLDGRRFLMIRKQEADAPVTQIAVVLNWFEELKRIVPAGGR
jgi:eukaryotic-like serine/threonine-protein kinase